MRGFYAAFFAFTAMILLLGWPSASEAASFRLSPAAGAYRVGQTFSVSIVINSSDQATNAFASTVSFPTDKLQIVSLSKSGSIMSLWVQEPAYSNANGVFSYEGIVLNPGYSGSSGKILTATFKTIAPGAATLRFANASALANDGQGTNVVSGAASASYVITEGVTPTPTAPEPAVVVAPKHAFPPPTILQYPAEVSPVGRLTVSGTAAPDVQVVLILRNDDDGGVEERMVTASSAGGFFTQSWPHRLALGSYQLTAVASSSKQVSAPSEAVRIQVRAPIPMAPPTITLYPDAWVLLLFLLWFTLLLALLVYIFWRLRSLHHHAIAPSKRRAIRALAHVQNELNRQLHRLERIHERRAFTTEESLLQRSLRSQIQIASRDLEALHTSRPSK